MNIKKGLFSCLTISLLSLSACSLTPPKSMINVLQGDRFQLNQTITYQPDQLSKFIQFGQFTTRQGFSRVDQHCVIELNQPQEKVQKIYPETFTITKVRINEETIAEKQTPQTMQFVMAQADIGIQSDTQPSAWQILADTTQNDTGSIETMETVLFYLKPTAKNPNIFRLKCASSLSDGRLTDAPRSHRPQRVQINHILGKIAHILPTTHAH